MAAVHNLLATILIQVGADEPKPIGTIEIPIEVSTAKKASGNIEVHVHDALTPTDIAAKVEEALRRNPGAAH